MGKSLKGKELGKGISQRKDGLYQARFTNRFGKRQTIYAKTYTEITKKLREEQYKDEKQLNVVRSDVTLDEWFDIWMDVYKRHCRNSSKRNYEVCYNRVREELGWKKLSDLSPLVLQKAFNNLKTDTSRKSSKLVVCDMLNRAVEADILIKNNMSRINVKLDFCEKQEKRVLSFKEIDVLYAYSSGTYIGNIIRMGLETGMRIGEITGLTWDCVDFNHNVIYVKKTLSYSKIGESMKWCFNPPKTQSSFRSIPMSAEVKNVLLRQNEKVKIISKHHEPLEGFENLVFPNRMNHPEVNNAIGKLLRRLIKRINDDGISFELFTPHCLRHTFATNCIAKGMNPKVLQKILGHNTLQMTMDLYCHVRDDSIYEEMSAVMEMV